MVETTLSRVGNSMAVILPKSLRTEACLESGETLRLESPRKGVVVITAMLSNDKDRLARLEDAELRIKERQDRTKPWPNGLTADALLKAGKDSHSDELSPV